MDFFEVLIILIFVVIPILEGVFKQRRKKQAPSGQPAPKERERVGAGVDRETGGGVATADEGPAADMIPGDLWEVLTGERRTEASGSGAPWRDESWGVDTEPTLPEIPEAGEVEEGWAASGWEPAEQEPTLADRERPEPVSLEYVGPEAISLEGPPPPPEVRHRLFHAKYDEPLEVSRPEPSGIAHELRAGLQGTGLRRSILLAEILGPPRGLS